MPYRLGIGAAGRTPETGSKPAASAHAAHEPDRIDEIARAIAAALPLDAALQRIVAAALDLAAADYACVWLLDQSGTATSACGLGSIAPRRAQRAHVPDALARAWLERPRAIPHGDAAAAAGTQRRTGPEAPQLEPLRPLLPGASNLVAPIIAEGRLIGGLSIGHDHARAYDDACRGAVERLAVFAGIALAQAELRERLVGLSLDDEATGLANRRRLDLFLDKEVAAARRGRRLSLLRIDFEGLGAASNAQHRFANARATGHGQAPALPAIVQVLRSQTRAMNMAARIGEAAFAVALSDADRRAAFTHARRIAAALRAHPALGSGDIRVHFGIATFSKRMRSPLDLIQAAEQDLAARHDDASARLSI